MSSLNKTKSGTYSSRKRIPQDVRDEYGRLYGPRHEAKRTFPASLTVSEAKARHAEWSSEIETRIATIRARQRGERQPLTERQALALAGEWYREFTARHEENPGSPDHWATAWETAVDLHELVGPEDIRPLLAKEAKADQFLADRGLSLTDDAYRLFLDCLLGLFMEAVLLLKRRALTDYSEDERLKQLPKFDKTPKPRKQAEGLTFWKLFEAYVAAKQPAASTVNRQRGVFKSLEQHFGDKRVTAITADDAQEWADGLLNKTPGPGKKKLSPRTVNEIYCSTARAVFNWAISARRLSSNPFTGIKVTEPRRVSNRETPEFTDAEVSIVLNASLGFASPKRAFDAARRWVPWLCAYTGARAGEMTQLRAADVVRQDGIWAVKITPDAGTVKTGKPRTVPLHEHLIEQGFLDLCARRLMARCSTTRIVRCALPTMIRRTRGVRVL
jgi:integrase